MKNENDLHRYTKEFARSAFIGGQYLLLTALLLICLALFGFAVLFSDQDAKDLVKLIFGN